MSNKNTEIYIDSAKLAKRNYGLGSNRQVNALADYFPKCLDLCTSLKHGVVRYGWRDWHEKNQYKTVVRMLSDDNGVDLSGGEGLFPEALAFSNCITPVYSHEGIFMAINEYTGASVTFITKDFLDYSV